jgi:hypothetical protein
MLIPLLCSLPQLAAAEDIADDTQSSELEPGERPRTSWVWVDPVKDLAPDAVAQEHISKILFVNRCVGGCTIQPGVNDARNNTSSIATTTSFIEEFRWSDEAWNATIDCVKDVYSPYNVQIVTEDPGPSVFHHEAILAGTASDLGLAANIGGIAPAQCSPLNNVISFSFDNGQVGSNNGDPLTMCWTVAQESAHSFGLPNHVYNCLDPMTYLPGCGKKYFRNESYPCGEFEPGPCNCSGATQNSHFELRAVFGDGVQPPPPAVEILLPKENDQILDGATVFWTAEDARLVKTNELWVNGSKYKEIPGHDYNSRAETYDTALPALPNGYLDIEIKSYNGLGSEGISSVRVLKGQPCANADACFDFQQCNAGRCEYPPPTQALGEDCNVDFECIEGICGNVGGSNACTTGCNPTVSGSCPQEGFSCREGSTGGFVCWPEEDTGGCCSVAGTKRDPMPWFGGIIFLVGIALLRRRARA